MALNLIHNTLCQRILSHNGLQKNYYTEIKIEKYLIVNIFLTLVLRDILNLN